MADPILEALRTAWLTGYGCDATSPTAVADIMNQACEAIRRSLPEVKPARPDAATILALAKGEPLKRGTKPVPPPTETAAVKVVARADRGGGAETGRMP